MDFCTQCGTKFNGDNAFCEECGAKRDVQNEVQEPPPPPPPPTQQMYCTSCGAKLTDGTRFCVNCGSAVAETQPQMQPVYATDMTETEYDYVVPGNIEPASSESISNTESRVVKQKASSGTKIIRLVVIFILCLGVGIGGAYLIYSYFGNGSEPPDLGDSHFNNGSDPDTTLTPDPTPTTDPDTTLTPDPTPTTDPDATPTPNPTPTTDPDPTSAPDPTPAPAPDPTPTPVPEPFNVLLMDAIQNTSDEIVLTIHWIDVSQSSKTVFERAANNNLWMMQSRDGDYREVFPDFEIDGDMFTIGFPTTERRYFLREDGTGRFERRDGTSSENLRWELNIISMNDPW
jgi:cell division septation protein DedD